MYIYYNAILKAINNSILWKTSELNVYIQLLNLKVNLSALSLKSSDTLLTPLGSHFSRFLNVLPFNIYNFLTSNISIEIVLSKLKTGSRVFEDDIFFRESPKFLHEVRNFSHVSAFRIVALR